MFCDQARVYFFERLGVVDYVLSVLGGRRVFYKSLSFGLRAAQSYFSLNLDGAISRIWYGSLDATTGIRKAAYQQAKLDVSRLSELMHSIGQQRFLDADCAVPVEKVLFDHFYSRYEFFGYAARYASEHPEYSVMLISKISADCIRGSDLGSLRLKQRAACHWLEYLGALVAIPLFFYGFCYRNRGAPKPKILNAVVCEVDDPKTLGMFASLFADRKDLHFVAQKQYMGSLASASDTSRQIQAHRLDSSDIGVLRAMTKRLVVFLIRNGRHMIQHGSILFEMYKTFVHGVLLTPNATSCLYLTFEHLSPTKSVRNALLSARHTKSVFVPYNVYAIDHFFAHEYRYNYDILCSPGDLLERVYRLQMATTPVMLRTGAYSPHLGMDSSTRRREQIDRLMNFKQGATLITILSSGIHDGSYTGELKLLSLAKRLAQVPGVKVAIRQKPGAIPEKFKGFFHGLECPQMNLLLTHSEYDLFDFLPVTDLFITSISSSAVDLCVAGGQFYSVDYWTDKDLYLWQTAVDGVFIPQNTAFETVVSWVKDDPLGTRIEHRRRMARLLNLITYQSESLNEYHKKFRSLLEPYMPPVSMA